MQITPSTVDEVFSYHAPSVEQIPKYERLRHEARLFARTLLELCPPSRELSMALSHLQEGVMCANASIALNPMPVPKKSAWKAPV